MTTIRVFQMPVYSCHRTYNLSLEARYLPKNSVHLNLIAAEGAEHLNTDLVERISTVELT